MFYDNLVAVCRERGLYPTQVIKDCGGSSGSIGGWKHGAWPNSEIVVKIAAHLDVSTDRLLLGHDIQKESINSITKFSNDALRVAMIWDTLDEKGKIITMGEIYRRAEDIALKK